MFSWLANSVLTAHRKYHEILLWKIIDNAFKKEAREKNPTGFLEVENEKNTHNIFYICTWHNTQS